jgi:hypothetical protein
VRRVPFVLTAALAVALPGCRTIPAGPELVEVPGPVRYVPIRPELTRPCPVEQPRNASPMEAVRVAKERAKALEDCNRDKAQIRAEQGTDPVT